MKVLGTKDLYGQMKSGFDFEPVLITFMREYNCSREEGLKTLDAWLQWFSLVPRIAEDGEGLQMLQSVDRIWHAFILNTKLYREFCETYIGSFVDHNPLDVDDLDADKDRYAEHTLARLQETFGDSLNPMLLLLGENVTCCFAIADRMTGVRACSDVQHAAVA